MSRKKTYAQPNRYDPNYNPNYGQPNQYGPNYNQPYEQPYGQPYQPYQTPNRPPKRKRKKHGCLITVLVLFCAFVISVGTVFGLALDKSDFTPDYVKADTMSFDERLSAALASSMDTTAVDGKIGLLLDEKQLNLLVGALLRSLDDDIKQYISGSRVTILGEDTIMVTIGAGWKSLRTTANVKMQLATDENCISLKALSVKAGKVTIAPKLVKLFYSEQKANAAMAEAGFNATLTYENATLTMSNDTVFGALMNGLGDGEDMEMTKLMLSRMFNTSGMFNLSFGKNGKVGASFDLSNLGYDASRDGAVPAPSNYMPQIKAKTLTLLGDSDSGVNVNNVNLAMKFLVGGYFGLTANEKTALSSMDFSSVSIPVKEHYDGVITAEATLIEQIIQSYEAALPSPPYTNLNYEIRVTEDNLNAYLLEQGLVGTTTAFAAASDDGYKLAYLTVESVYVDVTSDALSFKVILDVGGFKASFNASFSAQTSTPKAGFNGAKLEASLSSFKIGSLSATAEEEKVLLDYVKKGLSDQNWISVDAAEKTLTFDLTQPLGANSVFNNLIGLSGVTTEMTCEEGYIALTIQR